MAGTTHTFRLGAATISIINIGDIEAPLTNWMDPPAGGWPPDVEAVVSETLRWPVNCIHIALPGLSLLVDAGAYDATSPIANYQPPPTLVAALAALGIKPEEITDLVITHAHHDHFNGLTQKQDGAYRPTFPRARCYLGRADWEGATVQQALQDPASLESRTLAVLSQAGLLELVSGDRDLGSGARIIAAPGETPGHQIVRIESEGQTLYCLGDLVHHALEAEQPTYMTRWADPATTDSSRRELAERATQENALIVATHVTGAARLKPVSGGVSWQVA